MADSEPQFYEELGANIRQLRNGAGLTQEALGDRVGLTRTSITNIENGNQPVSAWLLRRLAGLLECDLETLTPGIREVDRADSEIPDDVPPLTADVLRRLVATDRS